MLDKLNHIPQSTLIYCISQIIPIITKLIDTCSILMDERYDIKIFLPPTIISRLCFKIAPFVNAIEYGCGPDEISRFENDDLLHIVATKQCLILKIETDSGIYVVHKQSNAISHATVEY